MTGIVFFVWLNIYKIFRYFREKNVRTGKYACLRFDGIELGSLGVDSIDLFFFKVYYFCSLFGFTDQCIENIGFDLYHL